MCILGLAPWFRGCWSVGLQSPGRSVPPRWGKPPQGPRPPPYSSWRNQTASDRQTEERPVLLSPMYPICSNPPNLPMWPIPDHKLSLCRQHSLAFSVATGAGGSLSRPGRLTIKGMKALPPFCPQAPPWSLPTGMASSELQV